MNPLELIDVYEKQEITKIQQRKENIPAYEIEQIIMNFASLARKAIYNGEFIFNLETMNNETIQVSDKSFNMKRLLSNNDKELLILQMADVPDGEMCESDLEILTQQLGEAVKKSKNIEGVLLLQPNVEISLLTAKTDIKDYASKNLDFAVEDLAILEKTVSLNKADNILTNGKPVNLYTSTGEIAYRDVYTSDSTGLTKL